MQEAEPTIPPINPTHPDYRLDDEVLIRIPHARIGVMPIETIARDIGCGLEAATNAVMRLRQRGYRLNTQPCCDVVGLAVSHSVVTWDMGQLNGGDYYRRVYETTTPGTGNEKWRAGAGEFGGDLCDD